MTTPLIANLEKLLHTARDGALLRFSLGSAYLKEGQPAAAAAHLRKAVELDPRYSAAWKLLGKALLAEGDAAGAAAAWRSGVRAAEDKGDIQAAKEMRVFLKRAEKALAVGAGGTPGA